LDILFSIMSMAKALLASFTIGAGAQGLMPFESFIELHGRSYTNSSAEFAQRKALYVQRMMDSEKHNSNPDRLWTAGVNKLWDWTENELKSLRGWDGSMKPEGGGQSIHKHAAFLQQKGELPKEKIWSNLQVSHHIRNQADCGSCWAIAAVTVLEGHVEIYSSKPRTFSAQQVVACTPNPRHCGGDGGCKGATAELAMDWLLKHDAAEESEMPYTGHDSSCTANSATLDMAQLLSDDSAAPAARGGAAFGMTSWETLPKNVYEPLARALAERGPVAVSVAADTWFNYDSGIFNGCGKDSVIDHAVVAMGYGEEAGRKYWVIQNSWGGDWGENGHIRLERHDQDDYCGMNNDPQKGVACEGETAPVPVCGMCGVLFDSVVPHFN
jgi:cathepsin L